MTAAVVGVIANLTAWFALHVLFARVGAVTRMLLEDVYVQRRRLWVRLHEKGGKIGRAHV